MNKMIQHIFPGLLAAMLGACSAGNVPGGLFGDNLIRVTESTAASPGAQQKYAASIRLLAYRDSRSTANKYKIGISTQRVIGMSGTDLVVDPDVSAIVTNSMRKHLDDAGFQLSAADALYELSGEIKVLNYDVKVRDEINIVVESTLTERATGKVVWSGSVAEKSDWFAGVSGNSKRDIANHLREKVGVVAGKTTEAISTSLMASRPDLFGLIPGTRPIAGVTVRVAPAADATLQPPAMPQGSSPVAAGNGLLLVTSVPLRARIYIDDVYYGLAPLRLELAAGVHNLRAGLPTFKDSVEKVSVRKGETTEIEMRLER